MRKGVECKVWSVKKVYAVVARSTFPSQNVQNTEASDHFWKLRCRKSVHRCGAKHMSKSKCTKHKSFGPLLEVAMSKKCTLLWREAHVQVKMYKTRHSQTTFGSWDVEKVQTLWREAHFQVKMYKTGGGSDHFWKLRCRKSARRCGAKHFSKSKMSKTAPDPLHPYNMTATTLHQLHYTTTTTPLRYDYSCSTLHYIQQLWVRCPLQPLQPLQQTQLQPPFGQSVDSLCQWIRSAIRDSQQPTSPIGFLFWNFRHRLLQYYW